MIGIILSSLFLYANSPAGLPSFTQANPGGYWVELPKARNYLFCGDRIFYATNFSSMVKIDYAGNDVSASFKQHCDKRRQSISERYKKAEAGEAPLILSSFEHLNTKLSTIPKSPKHKKYIEQKGYHYKELRSVFSEKELNQLRASNLLIPYLSAAEFAESYADSTNNPLFLKAEYSRYSSNLLTQNPAMLYTKDGKHYYFSFNLSDEQMRRLTASIGGGGGKSAGGVGGGGSGGSGGGGQSANPAEASNVRAPASVSASDLGEIPSAGTEAGFPGFTAKSPNLNVAPQGTILPASMQVGSNITLNVPKASEIRSNISRARSARAASSSRLSSNTSPTSNATSQALGNLNQLGGKLAEGFNRPSSSARDTSSGVSRSSSSDSTSRSPSSTTSTQPRVDTNSRTPSAAPATKPAATQPSAAPGAREPIDLISKNLPEDVPSMKIARSDKIGGIQTASVQSPKPMFDTLTENPTTPEDIKIIKCSTESWPLLLAQKNYFDEQNPINMNQYSKKESCTPTTTQYCGSVPDYKDLCLPKENKSLGSCNKIVEKDVSNICKKYFNFGKENLTADDLMKCAQVMIIISCNKKPCDDNYDNEKMGLDFPLLVQLYADTESKNGEVKTSLFDRAGREGGFLKSKNEILNINYIKYNTTHRFDKTYVPIRFSDELNKLLYGEWPKETEEQFRIKIAKLNIFYKNYTKNNDLCGNSNNSELKHNR